MLNIGSVLDSSLSYKPALHNVNSTATLIPNIATCPYFIGVTMFLALSIFHTVSVATLLTYKQSKVLLDGLSISIEKTLDRNAGKKDALKILKFPSSLL